MRNSFPIPWRRAGLYFPTKWRKKVRGGRRSCLTGDSASMPIPPIPRKRRPSFRQGNPRPERVGTSIDCTRSRETRAASRKRTPAGIRGEWVCPGIGSRSMPGRREGTPRCQGTGRIGLLDECSERHSEAWTETSRAFRESRRKSKPSAFDRLYHAGNDRNTP